eukprot:12263804-Alexandrium_andersonii.AAC.1
MGAGGHGRRGRARLRGCWRRTRRRRHERVCSSGDRARGRRGPRPIQAGRRPPASSADGGRQCRA